MAVSYRESYKSGQLIIKQGATGTCFYILEKGAVEVIKDEVVLNVLMYPGTLFGEISCILGRPRTSSIRARTETEVTRFESGELNAFVRSHPDIAVKMLETLAARLERTTQKLADSL